MLHVTDKGALNERVPDPVAAAEVTGQGLCEQVSTEFCLPA